MIGGKVKFVVVTGLSTMPSYAEVFALIVAYAQMITRY